MYYIPQLSKSSCGIACLKMLLAIVQKDEGYLFLNEEEDHGPYSYQDLVIIAQRYDVTLMAAKVDDKDDLRHYKCFPVILTVENPDETLHALLISQRKGNRVRVHDPAKGIRWQNIDSLLPTWDGTLLLVNHVEQHPYPHHVIDTKDKKGTILSSILQALTASFLGVATFFMKPGGNYFLPIIFASLSLVSEIFLRFALLKRMQRFDKYLRRFLPYVRSKDYYSFYERGQNYKRCSLTTGVNLVFSILIVILISVIALINSLQYLVLIVSALVASYLDAFFFSPYKNAIEKEVSQEEIDLRDMTDIDGVELQVKTMEVKSYRYAYLEFAKKGVVGLFLIIASVAISIVQKSFVLPNIIFYTCLSLLLYQSLTPLFGYDYRLEENLLRKARINNVVHYDEINSKRL